MSAPNQTPPPSLLKVRWTNKDDLLLCSAWLKISKDDVVGKDESGKCFWRRIDEFFNKNRDEREQSKRNIQALQNRWGRLTHAVSKFAGCYEKIRENGLSEVDQRNKATELYYKVKKEDFVFLHAWEVLRNEETWCNQEGKAGNANLTGDRDRKRTKNTESGKYTSSSSSTFPQASEDPCVGESTPLPMGRRDSCKGKGKLKPSPTQSTKSSESLGEKVEKLLKVEMEKLNLMKQYMEQQVERERNRLVVKLMKLDTSTMNKIQKKLYEKQMKKFLDE